MWLAVILNVGVLFSFKYFGIFIGIFNLPIDAPPLPTGISFYTFQAMSYVIDVRRKTAEIQKNPLLFTTYVTLFPQLVAGPIVRYSEIDGDLKARRHTVEGVASGVRLFCIGLCKKLLLANPAGECWERMARYSAGEGTVVGAWLGIVFFAFQIYFDFSGYSDMARGLGRMFGFEFPENFNYPYVSRSITEFWRRWHITLSSWFREYVYIPLGGNRRGRGRTYFNLLTTWLLTVLWHGGSLNFLLWGLYFFLLLAVEKLFLLRLLERIPSVLGHFYALVFILFGWLIFASDGTLTVSEAFAYFGQMLGVGVPLFSNDSLFELRRNIIFLGIIWIFLLPNRSRHLCRPNDPRKVLVFLWG
jgi:alginate O-acetyltransferase complex protein AlgI